jgi:CrcB protein
MLRSIGLSQSLKSDWATEIHMTPTDSREQFIAAVLVGIGGFAGSNLRYFVELLVPSTLVATASVNILGCIAIGLFLYLDNLTDRFSHATRAILVTGFIASFTTYSTFILDVITSQPALALTYVIGSYVFGFLGVLGGRQSAEVPANSPMLGGED